MENIKELITLIDKEKGKGTDKAKIKGLALIEGKWKESEIERELKAAGLSRTKSDFKTRLFDTLAKEEDSYGSLGAFKASLTGKETENVIRNAKYYYSIIELARSIRANEKSKGKGKK